MKNKINKIFNLMLVLSMMFVTFFSFPLDHVSAKTVGDVKRELNALEAKANETDNKIKYTQSQINSAKNQIAQIKIDMENISQEIIDLKAEIEELNIKIAAKDKETKELMAFFQESNGYSFYLEYIMGADSMSDFIYRFSVTEQLTEYNNKMMTEMNSMIKSNQEKTVQLNNKTIELNNKQGSLSSNLVILNNEKIALDEFDRSLADEIKISRDNIAEYTRAGCKDNDDISSCVDIPSDSGFTRPLINGYVTSEYSLGRVNPITGKTEAHAAIDVSSNNKSSRVYSVANGKVFATFYDTYGGNTIVIHHKIKTSSGYKYYTSTYCHLASISVSKGELVYRSTSIGIMGSTGLYTTGAHVHLAISTGRRYIDYVSYNDYVAHSINPRIVISFPAYRATWNSR